VLDETYTVEPPQDGERYVELRRVGENPAVEMAYHGPSAGHPDSEAFQVMAGIMDGLEGRLTKALVDSKLAMSASMFGQRMHDPGVIEFMAVLSPGQSLDDAKKAMLKVIDGIVSEPPSKEEMDRVKTNLLRSLESSLANPQAIATGALTAAVSQGDWRLMFADHDRLEKVTAEDVARVAKTYLKPSNRTVGYFIPDAAPDRTIVPASPNLKADLKDYKSTFTIAHGEVFDPTPANIESRAVRAKLPNGMKTVILPKQTEANKVAAILSLHFGDESTLKDKSAVGNMAGALFSFGTRTKNRQQLAEEMRKLDANINVAGGYTGAQANIIVPANNLTAALKLAVEMLREPGYPEADFQRVWQQRIKQLETAPTEPVQLSAEVLSRHLTPYAPGDAYYPNKREDQLALLKLVTLDDLKKFHDQYYGANYAEFAAVGPVDPATVRKDLAEIIGNWNTAMAYKPPAPAAKKVAPINTKIETPDKANAQFVAGLTFAMSDGDSDEAAMMLASYMFGGSITSRVSDRIRNREGLSYGASASIFIPSHGSNSSLNTSISLNPVNGPKVEASFVDELQTTVKNGFTDSEVSAAKKAYLEQRAVGRASDTALASLLASHENLGRTMQWDADLEKKIAALTAAEINAAFRRHIDPAALSIVKAGDFKAAHVYQ
jgi:zinc protease